MEQKAHAVSCLVCAIVLSAIPFAGSFEVTSSRALTGIVGQDVVLPCQISTGMQPDNMEVQWKKIIQAHIEVVYGYRPQTGQDGAGPIYQGRAMLLKDGFATGNVSLKLKNSRPADEGTYSCIVKSNAWSADTTTELRLAADASVSIDVLGPQDQGIRLACRSAGWFPKPELQWVTKNGQDLWSEMEMEQDDDHLFNVLSHVTVLGEETGEISCIIHNSLLKTEQKSIILLSSDIFPRDSPWLTAFWVLFALSLLTIGVCAYLGYTAKQKALKKKNEEKDTLMKEETQRKALESDCQELHQRLERSVSELEFRKARSYMVPVTLDTYYKHFELTVSENDRIVQYNSSSSGLTATSGALIAVGREGFVAGRDRGGDGRVCRWYWEVEVRDSPNWELGVLSESMRDRVRQEMLERPEEGFWAMGRSKGKYHPIEANTLIQRWGKTPTVIGVYLDLEGGTLSFYGVREMSLLLEIPVIGSGRLFPFLTTEEDQGKPLSICCPSDWDFPQKLGIIGSTSQGAPGAPEQPSVSNNGKDTENNTESSAIRKSPQGHGQQPASSDRDMKGNRVRSSMVNFFQMFSAPKRKNGDKTEEEILQAEDGKETPNPKSSKTDLLPNSPPEDYKELERKKSLRT